MYLYFHARLPHFNSYYPIIVIFLCYLQGDPKGSERFCEAVLRSLGDLKQKKAIPVKNSCIYLYKLIKYFFCDMKHGLTMTSYF